MEIWIGKITGQTTPDAWVQVHDFTPLEENKLVARGRLVAVVGFQNATNAETSAQGRELLSRLNELYYGDLESEPVTQLKLAVQKIQEEFGQENPLECICLAFFADTVLVVRLSGGVWAQVQTKEGYLVPVDTSYGMQSVSGPLRQGLTLVTGNPSFWKGMSLGVIKATIASGDRDHILETLGSVVNGNVNVKNAAGVVVQVNEILSPKSESANWRTNPKPKFQFKLPKLSISRPNIYLNDETKVPKRKRTMMMGLGFLVILLLLVGAWQFRKKQIAEKSSLQNTAIESLLYKYREALAISQLNPTRSRQLVGEVQNELAQLPVIKGAKKDPRVAEIETGLPQVLGVATGTKSPTTELTIDLSLLRADINGSVLKASEQGLVVLDNSTPRLIVVDPDKKKGEVVAGQEALGQAKSLATYPSKIEVVSDKGIIECSVTSVQCSVKLPPDSQMSGAIDIAMFGGNIYLLNNSSLWRYQVAETGFGLAQNWLAESETPDFSNAQSLTIDGSIWVGKAGGVIEKYTRGVKDNFNVLDLDVAFGQKISLFTDENSDKIYVLDHDNGRIVVLDKASGGYDSQYKMEELKNTKSFVVDETRGNIYLLTGSKILEAKL